MSTRKQAKRNKHEEPEGKAFMDWMRLQHPEVECVTFHVPNGGSRGKNKIQAAMEGKNLKEQGVKAGVPDYFIMEARGGYFAAVIEFKATPPNNARVTAEQLWWLGELGRRGYFTMLCNGVDAAMETVNEYLALEPTIITTVDY